MAERDAMRRDLATLAGQLAALKKAMKEAGNAHRALSERVMECQQRMAKMEKEIKKQNKYGNTLASKVQVAPTG